MTSDLLAAKTLWYLSRGTGVVSLCLLTAIVALGVGARRGRGDARIPRFATALLHRNLSLLAVAFLAIHIASSVIDPYAAITLSDAVLPLGASYRPFWLGLGAVAFDLMLALAVTSLLRTRLGLRTWRAVHWTAYACWPIALVHGLGTGSDVRSRWLLWLVGACVASVVAATWLRLLMTPTVDPRRRLATAAAVLLTVALLPFWLESGPLRAGWASHAGTPTPLLHHATVRRGVG